MKGGTISGNTVTSDNYSCGGGVAVGKNITFTMEGGTIGGNTAESGGGVYVHEDGKFTLEGGTIGGNSAVNGGGVSAHDGGKFTLEGGTIYGKSAGANANSALVTNEAALHVNIGDGSTAVWGTGGTYTKNGAAQSGGSSIGNTDDTLIAIPAP
jgi:hypothetical protein